MLYDKAADQVHILNETALRIWQRCDGRHGREAILEEMAKRYPGADADMLADDLDRVLASFVEKGLLEDND